MIRDIGRGVLGRNPVWVTPLALPVVLFASTSWDTAILFAVALPVVVMVAHLVAIPVERWLAPDLAIVAILVAGGISVTFAEWVTYALGIVPAYRSILLFRAISVSGIMLWPIFAGFRGEAASLRLHRVAGLVLGFALGLVLLTLIRTSLISVGFIQAGSLPFGLFLLALGRILVNASVVLTNQRSRRGREVDV